MIYDAVSTTEDKISDIKVLDNNYYKLYLDNTVFYLNIIESKFPLVIKQIKSIYQDLINYQGTINWVELYKFMKKNWSLFRSPEGIKIVNRKYINFNVPRIKYIFYGILLYENYPYTYNRLKNCKLYNHEYFNKINSYDSPKLKQYFETGKLYIYSAQNVILDCKLISRLFGLYINENGGMSDIKPDNINKSILGLMLLLSDKSFQCFDDDYIELWNFITKYNTEHELLS